MTDKPPHTKWATGSNLAYVSYAADPARNLIIALGAIDNLGKGAAGQAVQNANLITGQPETAGLEGDAALAVAPPGQLPNISPPRLRLRGAVHVCA